MRFTDDCDVSLFNGLMDRRLLLGGRRPRLNLPLMVAGGIPRVVGGALARLAVVAVESSVVVVSLVAANFVLAKTCFMVRTETRLFQLCFQPLCSRFSSVLGNW